MPYLYLLKVKNKPLYKIGITSHLKRRLRQLKRFIDCSPVFCIFVAYAANYERFLHKRYRTKRKKLTIPGGTEFFKFYIPLAVVFWMCFFKTLETGFLILIIILIIL